MPLLKKKNILITAGSTRGYLDAVRYITNTSTGKLSSEIAYEAMSRGAVVTYVYGTDSLFPVIQGQDDIKPSQLKLIEIETNDDLVKVIREKLKKKRFYAVVMPWRWQITYRLGLNLIRRLQKRENGYLSW